MGCPGTWSALYRAVWGLRKVASGVAQRFGNSTALQPTAHNSSLLVCAAQRQCLSANAGRAVHSLCFSSVACYCEEAEPRVGSADRRRKQRDRLSAWLASDATTTLTP